MQTCRATLEAGGFLVPMTAATIDVVQGITEDVQWRFVESVAHGFLILFAMYPEKCLGGFYEKNETIYDFNDSFEFAYINNIFIVHTIICGEFL